MQLAQPCAGLAAGFHDEVARFLAAMSPQVGCKRHRTFCGAAPACACMCLHPLCLPCCCSGGRGLAPNRHSGFAHNSLQAAGAVLQEGVREALALHGLTPTAEMALSIRQAAKHSAVTVHFEHCLPRIVAHASLRKSGPHSA